MTSNLKSVFDKSRQELLDMGLRGNTLLSLGKGTKVLDIVDEKSEQVFETLVGQSKVMSFLPAPEALEKEERQSLSLGDLTQYLDDKVGSKRHGDHALQTSLFRKPLETRLLKLNTEAITYVQEQGVDLLYLAMGFIQWFEAENSDKPRYAPLILVPVEIYRAEAGAAYKIRYTDAELGTNLTLLAKMQMEFDVILPHFEEGDDGYDLEGYFERVERAIVKQKKWTVERNKMALSFFSFGKFQMYQDLADDAWPEGNKPSDHALIQQLFSSGFEHDAQILDATEMDVNRVEAIQLVLDSDSSQTEAVLAAQSGASLVIQGPPGTGKSQTITNIISQALADNKKVLFVAEKMAALDVVKRRLDNCNIGDAVLELHSHKANKKAVLSSLSSTLLQHAPVTPERRDDIDRLVSLRNHLDDYCLAVNVPIANTGFSYQKALGFAMQYESALEQHGCDAKSLPTPKLDLNVWDARFYHRAVGKIQELVDYLDAHNAPALNLYGMTTLSEFSPACDQQAQQLAQTLNELHVGIITAVQTLSAEVGFVNPVNTLEDAVKAMASLRLLANKPIIQGVTTDEAIWADKGDHILQFAEQGAALQQQKALLTEHFLDQALEYDWVATRGALATKGTKWWRFLSGDYRNAKNSYAGLCRAGLHGAADEWVSHIDALLNYKSGQTKFTDLAQDVIAVIGEHYKQDNTDWQAVLAPIQWVYQTRKGLSDGSLDSGLAQYFQHHEGGAVTPAGIHDIDAQLVKHADHIEQLTTCLSLQDTVFEQRLLLLDQHSAALIMTDLQQVYELTRFNRIRAQLAECLSAPWGEIAHGWQQTPAMLLDGFQYQFFNTLVNGHYEKTAEIRYFDRVEHEKRIEQFTAIDGQLFHFSQESVVKQLFDNLPNPAARGEVETLRREFNKKRRQMPIRRLLNQSGRAIQQIKPVFMMSPMSIATYLEPGVVEFDLVIFDEASQVKVADALGAILRGKQVIVVGDTKQMPPTNFFGKQFIADDEDAQESLTADMESILGLFLASGTPERMLKWHYRSRHESLIAVSNQEFYDNKLMIFPSSGINPQAKGLSFTYLPHTTYDRGGSRTNQGEATAVAEAVMQHAVETPEQTLGVVAFSTAQRDAILLEVERLRKQHPEREAFFGEHDEGEDFFVKNLENVQGDERDTIFISIGYGKTPEGRLPMSFGPLNSDGGERRLNVLISRARMCMNVFSNFKADEMPTSDSSPFGVRALKNFLNYADTGELAKREETGKEPDSPFEEEVISVIRGLGYSVQPQVGCAGFYIDIAVRDPNKPGRYMLAVECDGATYHSSKSARDRDRIRQGVLEGLGWRFHRIWSTDWFRNRHKEAQRLSDALKEAEAFYTAYDAMPSTEPKPAVRNKATIERVQVEHQASEAEYIMCSLSALSLQDGDSIPDTSIAVLTGDIRKVVEAESPIHVKQLGIRILSAVGATRSGARINRAILEAIGNLVRQGNVETDGEYVLSSAKVIVARNRKNLPANERKFDLVYDGEIAKAALDTVKETYSITHDDLIKTVTEVLGFSMTSKAMRLKVMAVLDMLVAEGQFDVKGDVYQVAA